MSELSKKWSEFFHLIKEKEYIKRLNAYLDAEYQNYTCFPPRPLLFNAFYLSPLEQIKVVIIGQDPYHEFGQAMGLSFSVPLGIKVPPSLLNIYKEIENEYKIKCNKSSGDLTYLAKQGVLLLNSILSVREHQALSHNIPEYQEFFHDVLKYIDDQPQPIVFLLWGGSARKFRKYITNSKHLILESAHPSPLSANQGGWFGNNHFLLTNDYLLKNNLAPINWAKKADLQ